MTKRHSCENCATTTTIEPSFLSDYRFIVIAQHLHTGKIGDSAQFETERESRAYCQDMRERCTSHSHFCVIDRKQANYSKWSAT